MLDDAFEIQFINLCKVSTWYLVSLNISIQNCLFACDTITIWLCNFWSYWFSLCHGLVDFVTELKILVLGLGCFVLFWSINTIRISWMQIQVLISSKLGTLHLLEIQRIFWVLSACVNQFGRIIRFEKITFFNWSECTSFVI